MGENLPFDKVNVRG